VRARTRARARVCARVCVSRLDIITLVLFCLPRQV